jgi:hypothetical protein
MKAEFPAIAEQELEARTESGLRNFYRAGLLEA